MHRINVINKDIVSLKISFNLAVNSILKIKSNIIILESNIFVLDI